MTWRALLDPVPVLTFVRSFLASEIAGLGAVMAHNGAAAANGAAQVVYTWPSPPAFALVTAGAVALGLAAVSALFQPPPVPPATTGTSP